MIPSVQATSEPAALPRPGPTGMPLVLGELDEVPDDQEVAREPHLPDDRELPREPLVVVLPRVLRPPGREELGDRREALLAALPARGSRGTRRARRPPRGRETSGS